MSFVSGRRHSLALSTDLMAAALAINSPVFGMRLGPSSGVRARIDRLRMQWTCIAAFTVPITAGRALEVVRGSGAALAGGVQITDIGKRFAGDQVSNFDESVTGADVRIATTAALTAVGVTFEAHPLQRMSVAHVGAAGSFLEACYDFDPNKENEIVLAPGELLAIRNPQAMDAAGTWQLGVQVEWREVPIIG